MQEKVSADWIRLACHFDRALAIVPAFVDSRCALTAVEAGFKGNPFQLLKEMTVGGPVSVYKNPPAIRCVLLALLKKGHKACRYRDSSLFVILGGEPNVLLLTDVKLHPSKINVGPGGELDLLFAASGSKKELVSNSILVGHDGKQLLQLLFCKRRGRVFLEGRQIATK
jgi:hypothetical protein